MTARGDVVDNGIVRPLRGFDDRCGYMLQSGSSGGYGLGRQVYMVGGSEQVRLFLRVAATCGVGASVRYRGFLRSLAAPP